jgi:hypothetical protein
VAKHSKPRKPAEAPKVAQARQLLLALGLPPAQQKAGAAQVLLALGDVRPSTAWSAARQRDIGIHAMIAFIAEHYGKKYAENTRENIRKSVLRPLEQARVVDKNRDNPKRATNSKHTVYTLSEDALEVIRSFGTDQLDFKAAAFKERHGSLQEAYQAAREQHLVPVLVPSGKPLFLSPGKHNDLEKAVIEVFGPRWAPGARLLYLGDAAKKEAHVEQGELERLGISYSRHDKFPDILLHQEAKGWLFLIEAVTTHGPITPGRREELKSLLTKCLLKPIYVTAFPDLKTFKKYATSLAWETEVWVAEIPSHLIHYNGERFLGPAGGAGEGKSNA